MAAAAILAGTLMLQRLAPMRRRLVQLCRILQDRDRFLATAWCMWKGTAFESWARGIDPVLSNETLEVARQVQRDGARVIPGLPIA